MKYADEPHLTDQDRRAIEEIRRHLDRDLDSPWPEPNDTAPVPGSEPDLMAPSIASELRRTGRGLRLALGAGAVTLGAAIIGAFLSFADLVGPPAWRPVSAPWTSNPISSAPSDRAPAPGVDVRESVGGGVRAAESARRVVSIAERATTRPSAAREPSGGGHRGERVDTGRAGRSGIETQHRRWNAAVPRDPTGAPVGLLAVRSAPLTSIQAP